MRSNVSIVAIISVVLLVGFVVLGVVFANPATNNILIIIAGLVVTTVTQIIGGIFSERASKDIRNGVLTKKVKDGTKQALHETGVLEVVETSQRGETTIMALRALGKLLEQNTAATEENTQQKENGNG